MAGEDILVGIDGSPESNAALAWAAGEAHARGAGLHLLCAVELPPGRGAGWANDDAETAAQQSAEVLLLRARAGARELVPEVDLRVSAVVGPVVRTLLEEASRSALVVVGSRGAGALSRLLLGSVSYRLAAHAACPVVLVRHSPAGPLPRTGARPVERVVVGVGAGPGDAEVIGFALAAAQRHNVPLVAVRAWEFPDSPVPYGPDDITGDYGERRRRFERSQLNAIVAPLRARHPGVPVLVRVKSGDPAAVLTRLCQPSDLLVVGHRHSGRFFPPSLGAVSAPVAHHAICPLAVVGYAVGAAAPSTADRRVPATVAAQQA